MNQPTDLRQVASSGISKVWSLCNRSQGAAITVMRDEIEKIDYNFLHKCQLSILIIENCIVQNKYITNSFQIIKSWGV
jgi:hypothetical protein